MRAELLSISFTVISPVPQTFLAYSRGLGDDYRRKGKKDGGSEVRE